MSTKNSTSGDSSDSCVYHKIVRSLLEAPPDDEELSLEDLAAIREGLSDVRAGRLTPLKDVMKEFGL